MEVYFKKSWMFHEDNDECFRVCQWIAIVTGINWVSQ